MNVKTNIDLSVVMIEEPAAAKVDMAWGIGAVGGCL